jgi:hypothetical protein
MRQVAQLLAQKFMILLVHGLPIARPMPRKNSRGERYVPGSQL